MRDGPYRSKQEYIEDILISSLKNGPKPWISLRVDLLSVCGLCTVKKVKWKLGIHSFKSRGQWFWCLPEHTSTIGQFALENIESKKTPEQKAEAERDQNMCEGWKSPANPFYHGPRTVVEPPPRRLRGIFDDPDPLDSRYAAEPVKSPAIAKPSIFDLPAVSYSKPVESKQVSEQKTDTEEDEVFGPPMYTADIIAKLRHWRQFELLNGTASDASDYKIIKNLIKFAHDCPVNPPYPDEYVKAVAENIMFGGPKPQLPEGHTR